MAKRKKVSDEAGEAANLTDAADEKLAAARKIAQANRILAEQGISDDPEPEPDSSMESPPAPAPSYIDSGPMGPSDPGEEKLTRILSSIGGEGKFEVKKHLGSTRAMVGIYNINEWNDGSFMESLAHEHKGGTFTITFKDRQGRIRGQDTLTYDATSYGKGAPSPALNGESSFERFMSVLESRDTRHQQSLDAMRLENQRMMLEMMKMASGGGGGGVLKTSSDVVAIAKLFQDQRKESSPMATLKETVELLHALKEDNPVGEPPSPLNAAIDKAFMLLTPLLGVWAKKLSEPEGGGPPAPLPQGAFPAAPPQGQTQGMPPAPAVAALAGPSGAQASNSPQVDPRIAAYAQQLLAAAQQSARPEAIAGFIVDSIPEADLPELYDMVTDPGLISGLQASEPKLAAYQGWLVSLVRAMKERLEEIFEDSEESESAPESASPEPLAVPAPVAGSNGGKPEGVEVPKP